MSWPRPEPWNSASPAANHAHSDFSQLYDHGNRCDFLVTVFSNGTLITEAHADRFAALPPHHMEISLHGITRETFERVTLGQVSYDRCLQAIALLLDQQIHLVLKSAVMTLNRQEILDIKHYVESLGTVRYKLGEEMRPELDDGAGPFQYALCEQSSERTISLIQYGAFSRRIHEQAAAHQRVIKAQFELSYRCNRHCYTDPYNSKEFFPRELTLDDIHRLLDEMQQLGIVWPI